MFNFVLASVGASWTENIFTKASHFIFKTKAYTILFAEKMVKKRHI